MDMNLVNFDQKMLMSMAVGKEAMLQGYNWSMLQYVISNSVGVSDLQGEIGHITINQKKHTVCAHTCLDNLVQEIVVKELKMV